MPAEQCKSTGLLVIEVRLFPAIFAMAGLALVAKPVFVHVTNHMTAGTLIRRIPEIRFQVTGAAGCLPMGESQPEARPVVIESGFVPAAGDVALIAVFAEAAPMGVLLGMAGVAFLRGLAKQLASPVAAVALHQPVFSVQQEIGLPVVEYVLIELDDASVPEALRRFARRLGRRSPESSRQP